MVDAGPNVTIHQGDAIQLRGTAAGDILGMQWSPATGLDNPGILNPIATPTVTTKYTLTVQNQNTCTATDSLTVKVLPFDVLIPNAISPNHDGVNDVWNILHLDEFATCTVSIFSRYGQKLFTSTGYARPWDGTYKNRRLPASTYYYIIDLKDGSAVRSGYVVVVY
jgi:gliding motility-associated-like protein